MRKLLAVLCAALLLAACKSAPPTPTPQKLLEQGAQAMQDLKYAKFSLVREGEPVLLDATLGAKYTEGTGEYQAPNRVHAKVKVRVGTAALSIDMIWLPEGVWATNPLTGAYTKMETAPALSASAMLGKEGIPGILSASLRNVKLVGSEKIEEADTYHLRGEADGPKLTILTGILVEGTHTVDVWLDKGTSNVVRLHDSEPGGAAGWLFDLWDFNKPVEVKGP